MFQCNFEKLCPETPTLVLIKYLQALDFSNARFQTFQGDSANQDIAI
jgi:hypothetical protein